MIQSYFLFCLRSCWGYVIACSPFKICLWVVFNSCDSWNHSLGSIIMGAMSASRLLKYQLVSKVSNIISYYDSAENRYQELRWGIFCLVKLLHCGWISVSFMKRNNYIGIFRYFRRKWSDRLRNLDSKMMYIFRLQFL